MNEKRARPAARRPGAGEQRLYWLAYNTALETDILELLETLEVEAYTRWDDVKGRGNSGPHLNDEVWPAVNAMYMFVAPASLGAKLIREVQGLRSRYPGEGIKLIVQPCEGIY
jgi:hypothetical protein